MNNTIKMMMSAAIVGFAMAGFGASVPVLGASVPVMGADVPGAAGARPVPSDSEARPTPTDPEPEAPRPYWGQSIGDGDTSSSSSTSSSSLTDSSSSSTSSSSTSSSLRPTPTDPEPQSEPQPEPEAPQPYWGQSIGDDTPSVSGGTVSDDTTVVEESHELPELPEISISFENGVMVDGDLSGLEGCDVTFKLLQVDADGNEVEKVMEGDPNDFEIDFSVLTKENPVALFKVGATVSNQYGKVANIVSENTIGAMRCEDSAKKMAISIPFNGSDNMAVTAMNYISTETLSNGDKMTIFNPETGKQDTYVVRNGAWQVATVLMAGSTGGSGAVTPGADEKRMPRGCSVWLQRRDTSKPVYLVGRFDEEKVEVPVTRGSKDAPEWNLVGSPSVAPFDLNAMNTGNGVDAADVIIVERNGAMFRYTQKNGRWGYAKSVVKTLANGLKVASSQRVEDDTVLAPGTGFWYVSAGGKPQAQW